MGLLLAALLAAQEPPFEKRISIDVRGSFDVILEAIRQASGANIHVKPGRAELKSPSELVLKDVSTLSALRWLARLYDFEVQVRDGIAVLGLDLTPRVQRSHDVRGILTRVSDRAGPELALPPPHPLRIEVTPSTIQESDVGQETIVDLIKELIAPGTWEGNATIERTPEGDILVNHRPEVHAELERFLGALRRVRPAAVTVTAEIVEGMELIGLPALLGAADAEAFSKRLQPLKPLRLQAAALDGQRVHAAICEESLGIVGYQNGKALLGKAPSEVAVLDVVPSVLDGSRSALDLRLSLGSSRALDAAATPAGPLPRREASLLSLSTSVILSNGGGAVLVLPWKSSVSGKALVCLLRAVWTGGDRLPPYRTPEGPRPDLLERLKALPPADVDLANAPLADLAAWLRRVSGLNVVVSPSVAGSKVTVRALSVAPSVALALALEPEHLLLGAHDEAILISSKSFRVKDRVRTLILDVRDATHDPGDLPTAAEEAARAAFTGEDIANLLKNTVRRDAWEEADGKSICYENGFLFIRNEADVLKDCEDFVEERRRQHARSPVSLQAERVTMEATAAEDLLGPLRPGSSLVDAATRTKVLAAGLAEPMAWTAFDRQRTSLTWTRSLAHVADYDGADPILRGRLATSYLDLLPTISPDGATLLLEARFREERVGRMESTLLRDGLRVDLPGLESLATHATLRLPPDRWAVLRFPLPPEEGKPSRVRLLLLGAVPLR